jgi:hypothetical protein
MVTPGSEVTMAGAGREARLREEFGGLYPGLTAGRWLPASEVAEHIVDLVRRERGSLGLRGRVMAEEHFDFRGGAPAGERGSRRGRREDRAGGASSEH